MGFCEKHKIQVYDYCPLCEPDIHALVMGERGEPTLRELHEDFLVNGRTFQFKPVRRKHTFKVNSK